MGFRVTLALAAAVLPRAAALRPNIRGARRRLEAAADACPVEVDELWPAAGVAGAGAAAAAN